METIREGPSASRPPVLDGKNYSYWKPRMIFFIKTLDGRAWRALVTEYEPPMSTVDEVSILKAEVEWTDAEEQPSVGNARALNAIFNGVYLNVFKLINSCTTAKEACTTRKRGFPDAKKDIDTKKVKSKGILDAMHTASRVASEKRLFLTPQARVGQTALEISQIKLKIHLIFDAMQSTSGAASGIRSATFNKWAHSDDDHPGAEKPISSHVVRFNQTIGVCTRKTFLIHCLKWVDVGREYIKVVKGDLQRLFVLDFNDQAMNRFIEHQILTTFKDFQTNYHRHFIKYSDLEEARANPPNALYKLAERKGKPVNRVELFRETHVRAGTFESQAVEDAHNQMLELQSQPTLEGSQPLSEDEICDQVLGRRPSYSKDLHYGPKPKARRTTSASSSSTSCSQSTQKEIELQVKLNEALKQIGCKIEITKG
ncbi:CACTA en-spm transposon protein [Cucumis melo var. makuwa]|uniref:CACTA en-spm transposon protein n=1 Tax=Cucumis melo var. makuwa TaxID=1194695 RepID=A0A5A7TAH2_CUCMM|nr:CACTA en-spm transposon protein [Cucumis melo var. makuwa]